MNIDTHHVLEAAGTKWNFLNFKPGLVGGHCIGVDPFYLAQKAQEIGYHSELILTARRLNDSMGDFVVSQVIKLLIDRNIKVNGAKVLVLGITFKENCPDVRNTKAVDIVNGFVNYNMQVDVVDPWALVDEVQEEYNIKCVNKVSDNTAYDAVVLTVAHREFVDINWSMYLKPNGIIYDVKGVLKNAHKRL